MFTPKGTDCQWTAARAGEAAIGYTPGAASAGVLRLKVQPVLRLERTASPKITDPSGFFPHVTTDELKDIKSQSGKC